MSKRRNTTSEDPVTNSKRPKLPTFQIPRTAAQRPSGSTSNITISRSVTISVDSKKRPRKTQSRFTPHQSTATPATNTNLPDLQNTSDTSPCAHPQPQPEPETPRPHKPKPKRARTTNHEKLKEWLNIRSGLLDELHRHDGPCTHASASHSTHSTSMCISCNENPGTYRCRDCAHGLSLQCATCIVTQHANLPLHRVEKWNNLFFEKLQLRSLGLRVQLGHDGGPCSHPEAGPDNFMVFDLSGVHYVNIDYCGCRLHPVEKWRQLVRNQWFPATIARPQTGFTFDCLDTFHKLTLQGKGNIYDFYHTILNKSDSANIDNTVYRYQELQRAFRLWRNLMALKRCGRGLIAGGIQQTPPGGTTIECGACPHPGRNIPEGWDKAGQLLFLYTLFIAVDANFKLKCKNRKLADIELMGSTGVYVDDERYHKHIAGHTDEPELNTCESEHDAIVKATTQVTPGYAISGKGLALCTRHLLVRKNGVGDLQLGERYCNMDFIVLSALIGIALRRVVITYDIACQWSKNLHKRMPLLPPDMQIDTSQTKLDFAIPSWHINGHGQTCRENFNLGHIPGAARTCGEEPEVNWSHVNPLAASAREMALGAHRESLNDHWNGWNFRRTVHFRTQFRRRFKEAIKMRESQEKVYKQLTSTFSPKTITEWTNMVEAYEVDSSKPNPYEEPQCGTSLLEVRLAMAKEDAADAVKGKGSAAKVTLTSFFTTAFEIEDRQYTLRQNPAPGSNRKKKRVTKEMVDAQDKDTSLLHQIRGWREAQAIYTPYAMSLVASNPALTDADNPPNASDVPLYLPSSFPEHVRAEFKSVCDKERRMREGQADDALAGIRRQLRVIQGLKDFKKSNINGMGNRPNTRSTTILKQVKVKQDIMVGRYRRAYTALSILDPDGKWKNKFQQLKDDDLRGPAREVESKKTIGQDKHNKSSLRYVPSWIWLISHGNQYAESETGWHDSMRVEWVKARARVRRWREEYLLIQEEMRRWLAWLEYKATEWEGMVGKRVDEDPLLLQGWAAYANKQAYICRRRAMRCAAYWLPELTKAGIKPSWAPDGVVLNSGVDMVETPLVGDIEDSDIGDREILEDGTDEEEEEEAMSGDDELESDDESGNEESSLDSEDDDE